ncbi:bifunctional DNA-formamidopyrimidine glycosylase/DNA-(apurinic or apyrimidinic site) lyase [Allofranklinella schreckenbergeri]|uniref:Formamidopyrimidine-DNA glycosylase n=1 Tax=Allofranklinella schreckenbergeri TaxID=1076744 RepID=A0A3M6QVY5_9BURK|nr:bifunctional DNA-formamidopyrimidine glycosylase/DNA-(apurinic or apyrimidinic site) lyase [Allofranklinella schreckenbergeri]RMX07051.1 bifunctional DNA-formamidopyrimidine glycosylase/DNA-(apurinic or apyrimidinic site) lyase [Allofranklinella schreckenbergeri]
MPELPEVEVTRLGIAPAIEGQTLRQLILGKPLRWPLGCDPQALAGRRVAAVTRRGKYLLIHLRAGVDEAGDDAEGGVLLLHLGMSGSVRLLQRDGPHGPLPARGPHEHMEMVLDRHVLRLHDPRRFGALVYAPSVQDAAAQKLLARLGLEPLSAEFTPQALAQGLRGRRTPIKQALLAGDVVVGVGNIYASEALFLAGIHPAREAGRISAPRLARLHAAIVQVLSQAIAQGGSSLRDFVAVDGSHGHFQLAARVYGRSGQPCLQCGSAVRQITQGQRSTYYCPRCQR